MPETARFRTVVATGCAIALSAVLSACTDSSSSSTPSPTKTGTTSSPTPGTSATTSGSSGTSSSTTVTTTAPSTSASASTTDNPPTPDSDEPSTATATPASVTSAFLRPDQLPDVAVHGWSREYITPVHVEEPLPPICGNSLGTEASQSDVWDGRYPSTNGRDSAEQQVRTYHSASYAASRVAASAPKCAGTTAHTATGFAWHGTSSQGSQHVLFVRSNAKVATLVITITGHDYDPALDAGLLQTMAQRLANS